MALTRRARVVGLGESPGKLNYLIGNDQSKWRRNVSAYSQVRYFNAYPGIDLVYYGNQKQLEYDFVIAPGTSPRRIRMAFEGANKITIDDEGNLILNTPAGEVRQNKPIAYQQINGERREVAVSYRLRGNKVAFQPGPYDRNHELVIDPVMVYSTYLGGSESENGLGIAVDSQGNAYLTGSTSSTDFPVANAFQNIKSTADDAFIVKLNPAGTALVYATYLGGNGTDEANAIAVDAQGSAYVVGFTGSGSFPRTVGTCPGFERRLHRCFYYETKSGRFVPELFELFSAAITPTLLLAWMWIVLVERMWLAAPTLIASVIFSFRVRETAAPHTKAPTMAASGRQHPQG